MHFSRINVDLALGLTSKLLFLLARKLMFLSLYNIWREEERRGEGGGREREGEERGRREEGVVCVCLYMEGRGH